VVTNPLFHLFVVLYLEIHSLLSNRLKYGEPEKRIEEKLQSSVRECLSTDYQIPGVWLVLGVAGIGVKRVN